MTGDCHVRFCESGEAQSSLPLTKSHKRAARVNGGGGK